MSAITASEKDVGLDGVRRYRTKVKVRIDSHDRKSPLWISDDVHAVSTGKTVKGAGQANVTVLPRVNYMNIIRPNDYINIYFNIGDGEGWTRTFFGFVDRIEETYQVTSNGAPKTQYSIICTDFTKAFEKTNIYFNPHLAGRPDLAGDFFGTPNIGGLALMTSGVRVHGSPSDVVVNLVLLMLGFGTQFALPPSYNPRFRDVFRQRRAQFIQNRLGETAKAAIEEAGGFQALQEQIRSEEAGTARDIANSGESQADRINALFRERNITNTAERERILEAASAGDVDRVGALLADARLRNTLVTQDPGRAHDEDRGALDILRSSLPEATASLLDVIDVFGFVERTAIDGYHEGYTVWQQQGPLMSFLRSMSHEIMNELIFDLRPIVASSVGEGVSGQYSREADEIKGNIDEDGGRAGITHVPAMILREYPFSTIDGIDLRGVNIQLENEQEDIGIVYFGEIFSDGVGIPGRHVVQIPNINVADRRAGRGNLLASKLMDVAVVNEGEIIKTQFGRSDHEHFNLFEFYSDALLGQDQRFYMHDLLPIVTPIHIMRHGLRVRSLTTRFARFSLAVSDRIQEPASTEETEEADEAAEPTELEPTTELGPPVTAADGARFRNFGGNRWGYRRKPNIGPNGSWVMHQGIDIQGPAGAPIRAVADGDVVASCPDGVISGYGNCVVIRHNFAGEYYYTLYAHLNSITVGPGQGVSTGSRRDRARFCASGIAGGGSSAFPIRVAKGDQIGTMGNTGFRPMGVHLHFEVDRNIPPRSDSATPRYHFASPPADFDGSAGTGSQRGFWSNTIVSSGSTRPEPPAGYDRSFDPVQFFSDRGFDLVSLINETTSVTDDGVESEPDEFNQGPEADEDGQRTREDEGVTDSTTRARSSRNNVDNALTRQQLIRWALLHDHWYQHNLEYLSGRVEMRGAPEIRVGYRLDIVQRNMSFYVESVNHQWNYPDRMVTVLQVTRGQRNDPYPMYVLPPIDGMNPTDTQRRTSSGRLATYFAVPDPIAVRRALVLRSPRFNAQAEPRGGGAGATYQNEVDNSQNARGYNETVVLAGSVDPSVGLPPGDEGTDDSIRISGDLRFGIEALRAEIRMGEALGDLNDALRSAELAGAFDFLGDAGESPLDDGDAETTSGYDGRNLTSSLQSDYSEGFIDFLESMLDE